MKNLSKSLKIHQINYPIYFLILFFFDRQYLLSYPYLGEI